MLFRSEHRPLRRLFKALEQGIRRSPLQIVNRVNHHDTGLRITGLERENMAQPAHLINADAARPFQIIGPVGAANVAGLFGVFGLAFEQHQIGMAEIIDQSADGMIRTAANTLPFHLWPRRIRQRAPGKGERECCLANPFRASEQPSVVHPAACQF